MTQRGPEGKAGIWHEIKRVWPRGKGSTAGGDVSDRNYRKELQKPKPGLGNSGGMGQQQPKDYEGLIFPVL